MSSRLAELISRPPLSKPVPLDNGMILRAHAVELTYASVTPRAVEHRAVRWVTASELSGLDWLDADRALDA
jgi:8-oxo-dGTP diphosphatase